SNLRHPAPKAGTLSRLDYRPVKTIKSCLKKINSVFLNNFTKTRKEKIEFLLNFLSYVIHTNEKHFPKIFCMDGVG
ncbi:MAG: hypothetical protein KGD57_08830, partial [Candidatus Lokiarchaeota archaeon]|nr:hypothetical protein [Candidatus Lokiarchaeota archaeon]